MRAIKPVIARTSSKKRDGYQGGRKCSESESQSSGRKRMQSARDGMRTRTTDGFGRGQGGNPVARKRRQGGGSADNRPFFTRVTDPIISALRRITGRSSNFEIADSRLPVAFALAAAVVLSLLALPSTAEAQRATLNLRAGPHSQHASTEHGSPTFRFQVAASGNRQALTHFCGDKSTATNGFPCAGRGNSHNAVKLEFDVEWQSFDEYGLQRYSGYPVHTKTALISQDAVNNSNMKVGQSPWVWDRTVSGIPRNDQRPLRATVTMTVIDTTNARAGSTTTHQLVLNPTIAILTQGISASEGTDTHMEFPVAMTPPPLEPVTVDYATKDYSATAGSDYTATSGTLTFAAGETAKTIRVPITNDAVSDSGELLGMVFSNPTGAARMILLGSGESQSVVEALGQILNDEPGADDLPVVTIASESGSIAEGSDAVFTLTRTGETDEALTVGLAVAETGAMLSDSPPTSATFATGEAETELRVATVGDDADEDDSTLTVTLTSGETYRLGTNDQMASSVTVLDDDAATLPGGTVAVAGTTIWAADMTVTDYGNGSIGAGTADLLANQRSIEGLQARHLYYHTGERKLRMAFTSSLATGSLTLAAGNVKLAFPEGRSGDSSFTWDDVAVDWSDGQTFEARVVSGSKDAVEAPDPTLKALTVSDATLSPAFDADTVAYTATVAAATERVTLSGTLNDDDASLAYTPSTDADSSTAGHQVDVAVGDTTATVTVTAADGETTRAYRVVVKRPAPEIETSTPTLSIADGSGTEGADSSIGFTVTLDEAATDTVTVDYATSDGTATAGTDYTSTSGTLTFDAGTTSKTISVSIADDETDESDETFTVTLSNASGADLGTSTATGTITNRAVVVETTATLSIAGSSGTEGDDDDIDFTVTLDEAASDTVTVDYATSDGTADAGDDYTAKSGTLSFSAGTTTKTISVAIEDDIENEADETFTVTLSNASGADLGTSTATGTIRNRRVEPLTASFSGMPSEHDGSSFTFELHFSENPEVSFRTLKNHAFTVDEGDVTRAQRKNPQSADKNKAWTITVEPDGNETLSITLPATTSCSSNRGICTDDERKLSHSTSATVEGPVGISVGDVEVEEGAGVVLAFQVALTRAASSALTIDYSTSDGTATAGADYTSTSGTLTIGAGSSSGTVEVSGHRRRTQRGERDVHADAVERLKRDADRRERHRDHHQPRRVAQGADRALRTHRRGPHRRPGRGARERAPSTRIRRPGRRPPDQPGHGPGLRAGLPAAARRWIRAPTGPTGPADDGRGSERPTVRQQRHDLKPRAAERHRRGDGPEREHAGVAPRPVLRPRDGDGPRQRPAATGLELRAQPGDVERRRPLLLEPQRAVPVLRPGRRPRTQRRRPDLDVRGRLRQGPDRHRRVPVPQPGARKVRRRRQRTGQLCGDRAVPLDRLQGQRAGHGVDRRRLRGRGADAQPGRWSTDRDGPVNGDGGRRRPRPDPRWRRRLRPRVQGGHAMGRNADEGRERARRQPRLDQRGGEPAAHRARGVAEHDDRRPHGPDAERGNRNPSGRR